MWRWVSSIVVTASQSQLVLSIFNDSLIYRMNSFTKPPSPAWAQLLLWFTSRPMATTRRFSWPTSSRLEEVTITREAGEVAREDTTEVTTEVGRLPPPQDCRQHLDTEPCDKCNFRCSQWYHYSFSNLSQFSTTTKNLRILYNFYSNQHIFLIQFVNHPRKVPVRFPVLTFCFVTDKKNYTLSMSILPPKINLDAPR